MHSPPRDGGPSASLWSGTFTEDAQGMRLLGWVRNGMGVYAADGIAGVARYGAATPGGAGVPRLTVQGGAPSPCNAAFSFVVSRAWTAETGVLLLSGSPAPGPGLLVGPAFASIPFKDRPLVVPLGPAGPDFALTIPTPIPCLPGFSGASIYAQAIFFDPLGHGRLGGAPFAATAGVRVIVQ